MAFSRARILMRLCLLVPLCAYSTVGVPFSDDFFTYEVTRTESNAEPQNSFLHDMVFLDTGDNVRIKRQVKTDVNPASPPTSDEEDKSRGSSGRKKVPSGFSSNSTSSGKPSKMDLPEKKVVEKPSSSPKAVVPVADLSTVSSTPSPNSAPPVTNSAPVVNPSTARPASESNRNPPTVAVDELHPMEVKPTQGTSSSEADSDVQFPEDINNVTLAQNHVSNKTEDHHQYYNRSSQTMPDVTPYWVDMDSHPKTTINTMLSQAHRRAATVALSFDFPFYGHLVRNVTIATGGFLYTGEYVHSWLAATQYIAPLMANFDTSLSNQSFVKYVDNGTAFTVEWCKVVLQDRPTSGDFSFQATLHKNGDIVFAYRSVPVLIDEIKDDNHPVKVGLSDAYIIDRTIFFVRRKTIYEYHRINIVDIKNGTVIYLKALPTCLNMKDCLSCLTKITNFECTWCPSARRCSNGMDRYRQDWLLKGCEPNDSNTGKIKMRSDQCSDEEPLIPETNHVHEEPAIASESKQHESPDNRPIISPQNHMPDENLGVSMSSIVGILLMVVLICSLALWVLYAYRHPHSTSGQWLIRYRPSTWGWRRGEARYTAATIHM